MSEVVLADGWGSVCGVEKLLAGLRVETGDPVGSKGCTCKLASRQRGPSQPTSQWQTCGRISTFLVSWASSLRVRRGKKQLGLINVEGAKTGAVHMNSCNGGAHFASSVSQLPLPKHALPSISAMHLLKAARQKNTSQGHKEVFRER